VPPQEAKARIDVRGYDTESVTYLSALDHGYRTLPEFPTFVRIDGDAPLDVVSGRLREAVSRIL
jgi:dTMP kinase